MNTRCLICKQGLEVPAAAADRDVLLICPNCGFIGLWNGTDYAIPTHREETDLERVEGKPLKEDGQADVGDATVAETYDPELPLPYKRKLFVKVLTGAGGGKLHPFASGRLVLGRQEADVDIDDPKISRKHAVIEAISRENIFLRDLASTNGTYLNGVRMRSKRLRNGDVIRVGSTELQFLWQDEA